jgi:hypothetical protein
MPKSRVIKPKQRVKIEGTPVRNATGSSIRVVRKDDGTVEIAACCLDEATM